MSAAVPGQAPEVYRRWLSVDQPKNWAGPSESLIEQLWREKSDEQKAFWRSLDALTAEAGISTARGDLGTDPGEQLAQIRHVLADFDWETDDRQYALEKIDDILNGRPR